MARIVLNHFYLRTAKLNPPNRFQRTSWLKKFTDTMPFLDFHLKLIKMGKNLIYTRGLVF